LRRGTRRPLTGNRRFWLSTNQASLTAEYSTRAVKYSPKAQNVQKLPVKKIERIQVFNWSTLVKMTTAMWWQTEMHQLSSQRTPRAAKFFRLRNADLRLSSGP
jgi:hypothetical protein